MQATSQERGTPPAALAGVRVVDCSEGPAGGYATRLLAGLGAEVIKVEPRGGESLRRLGPFVGEVPRQETGALHLHLNAGKRSITLDFATPTGRGLLLRLIADADLLFDDGAPGRLALAGLGEETLTTAAPELIRIGISDFGRSGPYAGYQGAEIVAYALGAYLSLTGDPDREPLKAPGSQIELQAGVQAAVAALVALEGRDRHAEHLHADVSAMEAAAFVLGSVAQVYALLGEDLIRNGARLIGLGPRSFYPSTLRPCRDGYVHAHANVRHQDLIAVLMQDPRLADPRLLDAPSANADEIDALMDAWLARYDRREAVRQAQELRVPFTEVLTPAEVLTDPHYVDRDLFVEVEHPLAGTLRTIGAPFRMSETPWRSRRAPLLGEHNEAVYCGRLGLKPQDLMRLRAAGVV